MLTSAFLHSQGFLLHIVLNMYTLWIFGQILEPLLGHARFLAIYLLSAVGGSVGFLLLTPVYPVNGPVGLVGASGAIFGLFGALLVVQRQRGGEVRQLLVLIAINGVIGFMVPQIAWQAHLGGLVTGALSAAVIAYTPRGPRQTLLQAIGLAVVLALVIAVSVVRMAGAGALARSCRRSRPQAAARVALHCSAGFSLGVFFGRSLAGPSALWTFPGAHAGRAATSEFTGADPKVFHSGYPHC